MNPQNNELPAHELLRITGKSVELDGRPLAAVAEPIQVEHLDDELQIVRLALYVETVDASPAAIRTETTTYSPPPSLERRESTP